MIIQHTNRVTGHQGTIQIDEEDYPLYLKHKWSLCPKDKYLSVRSSHVKIERFHRLVLNITDRHLQVDHINGDRLDNRKSNLRIVTSQQNKFNKQKTTGCSAGYKGVCFDKRRLITQHQYVAYIMRNYYRVHLGYFETPELAAYAYNTAAEFLFKEFACLNNIDTTKLDIKTLEEIKLKVMSKITAKLNKL